MTPYELRYRDSTVKQPANIPTNEFTERILKRKSLRRFDPNKKLPPGLLEYLVAVAQAAPNSSSGQSWSVIALVTPEEKEAFRIAAGEVLDGTDPNNLASYNECSVFLIWIADNFKIAHGIDMVARREAPESMSLLNDLRNSNIVGEYRSSIDARNRVNQSYFSDELEFNSYQHIEWLEQSYYSIRSILDATIAAQTLSLAAESLGLGTLYMGSVPHCRLECFRENLNLPDKTYPIFGMCIGYEPEGGTDYNGFIGKSEPVRKWFRDNPDASIKPRQPQEIVLHRGRYNKNVRPILSKYNKIMIDYYKSVGRVSDYLVKKCVERIKKTRDQLHMMRLMGNRWR